MNSENLDDNLVFFLPKFYFVDAGDPDVYYPHHSMYKQSWDNLIFVSEYKNYSST